MSVDEAKLRGTTDALVWAEEFTRQFAGQTIVEGDEADQTEVGDSTMIVWFANAMGVATDHLAARQTAAVKRALNELGVPGPEYPAPVANAVEILLKATGGQEPAPKLPLPCEHTPLDPECPDCNAAYDASMLSTDPLAAVWRELMTHESGADRLEAIADIFTDAGWPVP